MSAAGVPVPMPPATCSSPIGCPPNGGGGSGPAGGGTCCAAGGTCPPPPPPPPPEPSSSSSSSFSAYPVRYASGEVRLVARDLVSNGFGHPWGHTRSYSNQLSVQAEGVNGHSWLVQEMPHLVQVNPTTLRSGPQCLDHGRSKLSSVSGSPGIRFACFTALH